MSVGDRVTGETINDHPHASRLLKTPTLSIANDSSVDSWPNEVQTRTRKVLPVTVVLQNTASFDSFQPEFTFPHLLFDPVS